VKRIRTLGACLVAIFAIGAVAAAGASAEGPPTFKSCVKAAKVGKAYVGKFTSKECTLASKVETGGKYELAEVESGTPFTIKSKATTLTVEGKVVKCKKDKGVGQIVASEAEFLTITFEGCAINGNKKEPCTTTGHAAGTIVTNELIGEPKWIDAGETQTGLLVFGLEFLFAEFDCGKGPIALKSIVIGTATNTKKGITATFKVSGGKQQQRAYWQEGEEQTNFGEGLPFNLYTNPGEKEATLESAEEQGPKGVGIFAS
jgi:hypothetical protein